VYVDERQTPQLRRSRHQSITGGEEVQDHGRNRQCSASGCDTRLSRYNPSATCATHAGWEDSKRRNYG
jgi:hypothetical protein